MTRVGPTLCDNCGGLKVIEVVNYAALYAEELEEGEENKEDLLIQLFVSAGGDGKKAVDLARRLQRAYEDKLKSTGAQKKSLVRLEQTVQIGSEKSAMSSTYGLGESRVDLEATSGKRVDTKVDKKKLQKAEEKIKAKMEKRSIKPEYQQSKLLEEKMSYEDQFLQVNPLQIGRESKNASKDIKIDGIDLFFAGNRLLTEASISLGYGRRYGLTGRNGVGKSTLLRAMSQREIAIPSHITILHVEQEITGDDTTALQSVLDADVWRSICLREQDSVMERLGALENQKSTTNSEFGSEARIERERQELDSRLLELHEQLADLDADTAEARASQILAGLGFSPEAQQQATKTFSGGWRMRLALARALFCRPALLLLDEPSNMLDVPSVAFLADYLQSYPSTVLVVSHDRAFLDEVATDMIHQHNERLDYYHGNFTMFEASKEERFKNQLREYESQMMYRKHLQTFIDKFRYNAAKSSEAQSRIKKLQKLPKIELPTLEAETSFIFPTPEKIPPPMLQMTGVSFGYNEHRNLLNGIDIDVQFGSKIGIIGPNGAGKTTVLKLLTGQLEPQGGLVNRHPRLRIGYFAQHHIDALDLSVNAVTFLARKFPGKHDEEYRRALGSFGITGLTGLQQMNTLSGGQKSRVAFAMLAMQTPHILVLDEPTNHLDISAMDALIDALKAFEGGVILVSHDVRFLDKVCTQLWLCGSGPEGLARFNGTIKDYQRKAVNEVS